MRAGFHSVGLCKAPILDAIRQVRAAGYAAIELNAETLPWTGPHVTPQTDAGTRQAIAEECRRVGLAISAVGAHVPMVEADPAARRAAIAYVNGCSDLARDVGAPVVHILSGEAPKEASPAEAWRWFADAVSETTAHAQRRGVVLGIEAIAGQLFHAVDDYARLARDLPGVPFRVNFDPSHLFVQGESPQRLIETQADRIAHMHMKDGRGRFPDFAFPPLGQGDIDFPDLIGRLRAAGYDGTLSVEYEAQCFGYHETPEHILSHARQFLADLGV